MKKQESGSFKCTICPHECTLKSGQSGICGSRKASKDGIYLESYSRISTMAIEPIEKKPFYHFFPGSKILSVGGSGCNLVCNFCQNICISRKKNADGCKYFSPSAIVNMAVAKGCIGVCMTYTEPIPYYEFLLDLAEKCSKQNIKFMISTNAYVNEDPWTDILEATDALNIDWKGDDSVYYDKCGANVDKGVPVFERIKQAILSKNHVEISVPVYGDSELYDFTPLLDLDSIGSGIKSDIPIHVLRIIPTDENISESSSNETVFEVAEFLKTTFNFVYVHNIFNDKAREFRRTVCPDCNSVIATREALKAEIKVNYKCDKCKSVFIV